MLGMRATFFLLLLATVSQAAPSPLRPAHSKRHVLFSQRDRPGRGFEIAAFVDQVPQDQVLSMAIRVTQGNPEGFDAALTDISDPASPRYGQWLTREQITAFTRPKTEAVEAVRTWLAQSDITATQNEDLPEYLTFTLPVRKANTLFEANYTTFINSGTGARLVRTLRYSIPEEMVGLMTTLYPGTSFFNPHPVPVNAVRVAKRVAKTAPTLSRRNITADSPHVITTSQLNALWEFVQEQANRHDKPVRRDRTATFLSRGFSKSPPTSRAARRQRAVIHDLQVRQEDPTEILRKVNESMSGTLPTDTIVISVPPSGDLSGMPPWMQEIIVGIENGDIPVTTVGPVAVDSTTVVSQPSPPPTDTVTTTTPTPQPTTTETPGESLSLSASSSSTSPPPPPPTTTEPVPSTTESAPIVEIESTESATPSDIVIAVPTTDEPPPEESSPASIPSAEPGDTDDSCQDEITPECLRQLYKMPDGLDGDGPVGIAVTGYIEQFGQADDLREFLEEFRTDVDSSTTFETVSIAGGVNPQGDDVAGVEANLDLQYTIGIAPGVPVQFVSVGKSGTGNGFLDTITTMIAQEEVPEVVTTSYGLDEDDVGADVAEAMCDAYKQLTARGVSILFASGDSGVGDGRKECDADGIFQPTFPSGCSYVTSVGSTDGVSPERAASFSSGGFSNLYPAPAYQTQQISQYLASQNGLNAGRFNTTGRGFPDVSVQGTKYVIVHAGEKALVQGTSASCPVFASMIALINAERSERDLPPLGFLNPWLYGVAAPAFMDITEGSNPGCGTEGWPAAPGWDPVTGLGTPSYPSLRAAAGLN